MPQFLVLERLLHLPLLGRLLRLLANSLMWLNLHLANEFKENIVNSQTGEAVQQTDWGLGASQAFLAIPVLVTLSVVKLAYKNLANTNLKTHRQQ